MMKLSEAILKGIEKFPRQAKQLYFSTYKTPLGACAIGCAMYATAGEMVELTEDELLEAYPCLNEFVEVPIAAQQPYEDLKQRLFPLIMRMNDTRGYTREQIAAWLQEQGY